MASRDDVRAELESLTLRSQPFSDREEVAILVGAREYRFVCREVMPEGAVLALLQEIRAIGRSPLGSRSVRGPWCTSEDQERFQTAKRPLTTEELPCEETILSLEQLPRLGEVLAGSARTCRLTMAASAQMRPFHEVIVDARQFTVGVDSDRRIRFISTIDSSFSPPEGLHVGDALSAVLKVAPGAQVVREMGWGHYVELSSGWCAFIDDSGMDDRGQSEFNLGTAELGPKAVVKMFFMR
jgi:hypothetical protein